MNPFGDLLRKIIDSYDGEHKQGSADTVRNPIETQTGDTKDNSMAPSTMMKWKDNNGWKDDVIYSDTGQAMDMADKNPFKQMIDKLPGGGQGTMTGMLKLLFGSDPIAKQKDMLDNSGMSPRIGGSNDPNHVPGAGVDAVLDPKPMAKQSQKPLQQRSGLIEPGNIDLNNRPTVQNDDGSISTILSKSFNFDGKETLLPTISDDGRKLTDAEAIDQYKQTGRHLGIFGDINSATKHAEGLHNEQAKRYKYAQPTALDPQSIEELRQSLLTQAGQMDPGNPNGLAGRMSSPLAPSDMGRQGQEAINISDDIRGHNGRKSAAIKKGNIR